MMNSARNIANGLLVAGIFAVVFASVGSFISCGANGHCSVASVIFGVPEVQFVFEQDNAVARSTAAVSDAPSASSISLSELSGTVGVYLLTLAVLVLIVLEIFELYYIRKLFGKKIKV